MSNNFCVNSLLIFLKIIYATAARQDQTCEKTNNKNNNIGSITKARRFTCMEYKPNTDRKKIFQNKKNFQKNYF